VLPVRTPDGDPRDRSGGQPVGRKRRTPSPSGKGTAFRRARKLHDLTAGGLVNRLVSTKVPVRSRFFGPHAVASSLKTCPGALNREPRPMKRSDLSGRCFHLCHRRLPLTHKGVLDADGSGPGQCLGRRTLAAHRPEPIAEMRQPPSIKISGRVTRDRWRDPRRIGPGCRNFRRRDAFVAPPRASSTPVGQNQPPCRAGRLTGCAHRRRAGDSLRFSPLDPAGHAGRFGR
jgi:hypothetical protein